MSKSILVDTDVLIEFLRGHEQAVSFVNLESDRIILSSIVVVELKTLNVKHYPMFHTIEPAYRK